MKEAKEKFHEVDAETVELIKKAVEHPIKKVIVAAFVNGLEMRSEINPEQKETA